MINYKIISKVNPRDLAAQRKLYAVKQAQNTITLRELSQRISRESTLSVVDIKAVLEGLLQAIPDELNKGNIVKLNEFGTFRLTLQSTGAETEEEFSSANIKKVNIRFRPDALFTNMLANAQFKKVV